MLAWAHVPALGLCMGPHLEPLSCLTPSAPQASVHPVPGPPLQAEQPGQYRVGFRKQGSLGGWPSPIPSSPFGTDPWVGGGAGLTLA